MDFAHVYRICNRRLSVQELEFLYNVADEISPKNILEIGGADGCSSIALGYVAQKYSGQVQTIEPQRCPQWDLNIKSLGLDKYVTKIRGRSIQIPIDKINVPIDFLFIDGDHRTEHCLKDYYYFSDHIKEKGRIAFHDVHSIQKGPGLKKALAIILEANDVKQIYDFTKGRGIIVLEKQKRKE